MRVHIIYRRRVLGVLSKWVFSLLSFVGRDQRGDRLLHSRLS